MLNKNFASRLSSFGLTAWFFISFLISGIATNTTVYAFPPGSGTLEDPWLINSCAELQTLRNADASRADDYYKLGQSFACVGTFDAISFSGGVNFSGDFNGNGQTITNLTISDDTDNTGLFRRIDEGKVYNLSFDHASVENEGSHTGILAGSTVDAEISDVSLLSSSVESTGDSNNTGGLVGLSNTSTFENINSNSKVTGATGVNQSDNVGGIVGQSVYDSFTNVDVGVNEDTANPQVKGTTRVGGVLGFNLSSNLQTVDSAAYVYGNNSVGGLFGSIGVVGDDGAVTSDAHATGNVHAVYQYAGGLVGDIYDESSATETYKIHDSSATGQVEGSYYVGGFVAYNGAAEIYNSYATGDIISINCECSYLGGFVGVNGQENDVDGYIHEAFATGDVDFPDSGTWDAGGFVASMDSGTIENTYSRGNVAGYSGSGGFASVINDGQIDNSYSTGIVLPDDDNRGFMGNFSSGDVTDSFWDFEASQQDDSDAGIALSTAQAKVITAYQNAGWDIGGEGSKWQIYASVNDGYPCLSFYAGCTEEVPVTKDLNGDGIDDSSQPNIGGYLNHTSGKITAIDVGEGCELTTDDYAKESELDVQDVAYDYESGLWDFETDCVDEGVTTTIKLYYYDTDPGDKVLRKYNPETKVYFTIDDAQINSQTIDGHKVTVVTYQIKDNGDLDMNPEPGMIADPAGLADLVVESPNTGLEKINQGNK